MRYLMYTVFFLVSAFAKAQSQQAPQPPIIIGVGDMVFIGEHAVQFNAVVEDSRCPADVTCIQAGSVKVDFELIYPNESLEERRVEIAASGLSIGSNRLADVVIDGVEYRLCVAKVNPYPLSGATGEPEYACSLELYRL